jgi:3-hydroxyisobutyrate dehydrogenase-like beta-hydroxyacid dehydrogenase
MLQTPAGFRLPLGVKDIELALKTGGEGRTPMLVAGIVRDLLSSIEKSRAEMGWSALALVAREDAGLPAPK